MVMEIGRARGSGAAQRTSVAYASVGIRQVAAFGHLETSAREQELGMHADDFSDLVHTGPGTLAGRFMRTFWQPVYRAEDLASGQARHVRIMGQDFVIYRGEQSPAVYLLDLRCAHRRAQLNTGWVEEDTIRCFYHGWRYDGTGQCVEQPGEDPAFAAQIRMRAYPTQEYLGLVFAYLGDGDPPPLPRYAEFADPGVLDVYPPEYWPCNYFNRIDNACDAAHLSFAHRESRRAIGHLRELPTVSAEETEYGVVTTMTPPGGHPSTLHFHMPNINVFFPVELSLRDPQNPTVKGRLGRLLFRVPVDDEHCVSFPIDHVSLTGEAGTAYLERRRRMEAAQLIDVNSPTTLAQAVLRNQLAVQEVRAIDSANLKTLTSVEDYVAQVGQGPIVQHGAERLGRMDVGIRLVRTLWQRELRAMAEGRPLKPWGRLSRLVAAPA